MQPETSPFSPDPSASARLLDEPGFQDAFARNDPAAVARWRAAERGEFTDGTPATTPLTRDGKDVARLADEPGFVERLMAKDPAALARLRAAEAADQGEVQDQAGSGSPEAQTEPEPALTAPVELAASMSLAGMPGELAEAIGPLASELGFETADIESIGDLAQRRSSLPDPSDSQVEHEKELTITCLVCMYGEAKAERMIRDANMVGVALSRAHPELNQLFRRIGNEVSVIERFAAAAERGRRMKR